MGDDREERPFLVFRVSQIFLQRLGEERESPNACHFTNKAFCLILSDVILIRDAISRWYSKVPAFITGQVLLLHKDLRYTSDSSSPFPVKKKER